MPERDDQASGATLPQFGGRAAQAVAHADTAGSAPGTATATSAELVAGSVVGRFEVVSMLGAGGMGVVLLASDPLLGRQVALKVLHGDTSSATDAAKRRLMREAQGIAKLSHENVIIVHEVGEHAGRVYVAMEYVVGGTLTAWQRDRPWAEIVDMYLRAGRGLEAAHAAGLVHRDFKPDNVLVGEDRRVRVTDFGLVAAVDAKPASEDVAPNSSELAIQLTRTGAIMGTPRYMAPEQHRGEPVDARADQFAFCVALYEAVYQARAFAGESYPELVASVLGEDVLPAPPGSPVPPAVRAVLLRGLSRARDDRYASMHELLAALEVARRPPAAAPPKPSRRGLWIGLAGVAVVAIVGGGTLVKISRDRKVVNAELTREHERAEKLEKQASPIVTTYSTLPRDLDLRAIQMEFEKASTLLGKFDCDGAAAKFTDLSRTIPSFVYDVGVSYHRKGDLTGDPADYRKAIDAYKVYVATFPGTSTSSDAQHTIEALERELARLATTPRKIEPPTGSNSYRATNVEDLGSPDALGVTIMQSEPAGATLYVDDRAGGPVGVTPWAGVVRGRHKWLLELRGYARAQQVLTSEPSRLVAVGMQLASDPTMAWLELTADAPAGDVALDGKSITAFGTAPIAMNIPAGHHTLVVSAPDHAPFNEDFDVAAGSAHTVAATLAAN